jgi:hypothetical protein
MCVIEGVKNNRKKGKSARFRAKIEGKWLISLRFGVKFIKIERFEPKVYLFDANSLLFSVPDKIQVSKTPRPPGGMEYIPNYYYPYIRPTSVKGIINVPLD